jgi:hypothetical protein
MYSLLAPSSKGEGFQRKIVNEVDARRRRRRRRRGGGEEEEVKRRASRGPVHACMGVM